MCKIPETNSETSPTKKDVFTSYLEKGRMSRIPSVAMKGTTVYYTVFCMNKFRCLHAYCSVSPLFNAGHILFNLYAT